MTSTTIARRIAAALVPLALVAAALSGCAAASSSGGAADASGAWSYTDDTGKKVSLDKRPTRIAAFTDYGLGLESLGVDPVAVFGRVPVATDPRFSKADLKGVTIVGNSYGELDLEKLAEAAPDLIVTGIYPTDRKGNYNKKAALYGFADVEQQKQVEKIAPIVALGIGGKGRNVIANMNRLASALGAKDSAIAAAKKDFDSAAAQLTAAAKSGIEVTQLYADTTGIYVVKPDDEPQTQLYKSLGVNYTNRNPGGKYYWDIYSWENAADMMTGDVVLVNREGYQPADLAKQPTYADSPALKAGQVYPWLDAGLDYRSQADQMRKLAKLIAGAKKV